MLTDRQNFDGTIETGWLQPNSSSVASTVCKPTGTQENLGRRHLEQQGNLAQCPVSSPSQPSDAPSDAAIPWPPARSDTGSQFDDALHLPYRDWPCPSWYASNSRIHLRTPGSPPSTKQHVFLLLPPQQLLLSLGNLVPSPPAPGPHISATA